MDVDEIILTLKEPILSHMQIDSVLCTDGMQAYGKLSREHGIERKNTKEVDERSYHIQGISSLHSQVKEWLRSFHGIASKYIDNYLGFFAYQKSIGVAV